MAERENGGGTEAPASPGGGARLAVRSVEAMDHPISPVGGGSIRSR